MGDVDVLLGAEHLTVTYSQYFGYLSVCISINCKPKSL